MIASPFQLPTPQLETDEEAEAVAIWENEGNPN